jgi:hypothetical protein
VRWEGNPAFVLAEGEGPDLLNSASPFNKEVNIKNRSGKEFSVLSLSSSKLK